MGEMVRGKEGQGVVRSERKENKEGKLKVKDTVVRPNFVSSSDQAKKNGIQGKEKTKEGSNKGYDRSF